MNTFNTKRFCAILTKSFVEERSFFIKLTTGLALFFSLTAFVANNIIAGDAFASGMRMGAMGSGVGEAMALFSQPDTYITLLFVLIYANIIYIGCSLMFRNMDTKQQRIAFLMLPCSNAEKFLSRVVLAVGGGTLAIALALVAADAVQLTATWLLTGNTPFFFLPRMVGSLWNMLIVGLSPGSSVIMSELYDYPVITEIMGFVFSLSLFTLCGTLVRRMPWALGFVSSWIIGLVFFNFSGDLAWLRAVVYGVGAVAAWAVAYRVFKRTQVITNNNLNV